jgi:hypothetical protein
MLLLKEGHTGALILIPFRLFQQRSDSHLEEKHLEVQLLGISRARIYLFNIMALTLT